MGTHERRAATKKAREVLYSVERLFHALAQGELALTPDQIREKVKAYALDCRREVDTSWLERRNATEDGRRRRDHARHPYG